MKIIGPDRCQKLTANSRYPIFSPDPLRKCGRKLPCKLHPARSAEREREQYKETKTMVAPGTTKVHKIEKDAAGPGGRPRLTCHGPDCNVATLVRQPYMSDLQWEQAVRKFSGQHGVCPRCDGAGSEPVSGEGSTIDQKKCEACNGSGKS